MTHPAEAPPFGDIIADQDYRRHSFGIPGTSSDVGIQHFTISNGTVFTETKVAGLRGGDLSATSCARLLDARERFARTEKRRSSVYKSKAATPALSPLDEIIEASRAILEIEAAENEVHVPYTEATWTRAVEFLRRNTKWVSDTLDLVVDLPEILPGPDGSIDLHWDYPGYEILINIPADPVAKAGFYGDDRGQMSINTKFDLNTFNHGLLLWLAQTK